MIDEDEFLESRVSYHRDAATRLIDQVKVRVAEMVKALEGIKGRVRDYDLRHISLELFEFHVDLLSACKHLQEYERHAARLHRAATALATGSNNMYGTYRISVKNAISNLQSFCDWKPE